MKHDDYMVGWICALPIEMAAAKGMLDEEHQDLPISRGDSNQYTLGRIGNHNVAIACLPDGMYGITSAALAANGMLWTFQSIRIGLMVGIGGGVPHLPAYDIRLGDVVVSVPRTTNGGIIQYDLGKTAQGGQFHRVGSLNSPPQALLTAVAKLQAKHLMKGDELLKHISTMIERHPKMQDLYAYRDTQNDQLFEASYEHRGGETTCAECDISRLVHRKPRPRDAPSIHYGLVASGNQVIKDARTRDLLRARLWDEGEGEVLCFEMEAAGLMNSFPCLVIRGISDYTDTHKNKDWQHRAAATAAAYAKEFLYDTLGSQIAGTQTVAQTLRGDRGGDLGGSVPTGDYFTDRWLLQRSRRTAAREYHSHAVLEFIDENLPEFYNRDDSLRDLSQKAAVTAEEVTAEFGLRPELTKKVARLALYDFVILCDDSYSMTQDKRRAALEDTLQRVAKFATKLEPSGMSIRFLNFSQDREFNNLNDVEDLMRKVRAVDYDGPTKLGQTLHFKIVEPMVFQKQRQNTFAKPIIVTVITDGEPTAEPRESLRNTILRCKRSEALQKFGKAAVVFLISRVGHSPEAEEFLRELEKDPELEDMVYCSLERLDDPDRMAVFQRCKDDIEYTAWLIEMFLTALDSQTKG